MTYRCATCDEEHDDLPDLGLQYPDPYLAVPEHERAHRATFTSDVCTTIDDDGEHYFIRGVILIPILERDEPFGIGAWVSQSKSNFDRYVAGEDMDPTFGWLVNRIAGYEPSTALLKTQVHFRTGKQRPTIVLEPTEHPLAVQQREGISLDRAWAIVHPYLAQS